MPMANNAPLASKAPYGLCSMQSPIFKSLMQFSLSSPRAFAVVVVNDESEMDQEFGFGKAEPWDAPEAIGASPGSGDFLDPRTDSARRAVMRPAVRQDDDLCASASGSARSFVGVVQPIGPRRRGRHKPRPRIRMIAGATETAKAAEARPVRARLGQGCHLRF
jgi:hypothetical protein